MKNCLAILICFLSIIRCTYPEVETKSVEEQLFDIKSGMNFEKSPQYNRYKLAHLDSIDLQLEKLRANASLVTYYKAKEMVNAGQELGAIDFIFAQQKRLKKQLDSLDEVLLEAYLRSAESSNCVHHHSANSCIMPIKGDGIHEVKDYSLNGLALINSMLEKDSSRMDLKWLYNVLSMTIGEFPEGVPENFRLDIKNRIDSSVLKFVDEGINRGIAVNDLAGGTCLDDFDNDGDLDVIFSSMTLNGTVNYYENENGVFVEKTEEKKLNNVTGGLNMIHTDFNNDGYLDVYILRGGWEFEFGNVTNSLLKNVDGKYFEDVTIQAGLLNHAPCGSAVWADFNNDGYLDLYEGIEENDYSRLYINNKNETFAELSKQANCSIKKFVKGVVSADIENDGDMDIFVSIVGDSNILFLNEGIQNGIPQFKNVAEKRGVALPLNAFSTLFFDYDNDGDQDLLVDYGFNDETIPIFDNFLFQKSEYAPILYKNNGSGEFQVAGNQGFKTALSMGLNCGDLNNDGFKDLYLGTGSPSLKAIFPNEMYLNNQGVNFSDITYYSRTANLQKGHGVAIGDFDEDGDNDIFLNAGGFYDGDNFFNSLYVNPGNNNNWIKLKLQGKNSNSFGVGSTIKVNCNGKSFYHTVSTGGSFGSSPLQAFIGLGIEKEINSIDVVWSGNNNKMRYTGLQPGLSYTLKDDGSFEIVK